jgi:hypothetical protein
MFSLGLGSVTMRPSLLLPRFLCVFGVSADVTQSRFCNWCVYCLQDVLDKNNARDALKAAGLPSGPKDVEKMAEVRAVRKRVGWGRRNSRNNLMFPLRTSACMMTAS